MSKHRMIKARHIALGAGFFFITLATFTQGILPAMQAETRQTKVTKVVRTDLGELKWTTGNATDYTDTQAHGRRVYIREGCAYCHSQYVRPVTGETRRWGPVSQAGEYAFDQPHLFSTRRIGPDITRVGLKYSNGWHIAHLWNPRIVVTDSIMPSFPWLFVRLKGDVKIVENDDGERTLEKTSETERLFDFSSDEKIVLTPNEQGLVYVADKGRYPVIHTPDNEFSGDSLKVIGPAEDLTALVGYLQKMGTNRGKWRDLFVSQRMQFSQVTIPRSQEWIDYGQNVYERRCTGCHGETGNGNGPASTFLAETRPRNFTSGTFKFRLTPSGSLPSDGDLLRTITQGVRGTAMPSFHMLTEKDRLAVIQYVKYGLTVDRSDPDSPYNYFVEEEMEMPITIAATPPPSAKMISQGAKVWKLAKCFECHGKTGAGNGEKAKGLTDDWDYPIPPADLTVGQFKSGPGVEDVFRTLSTGLNGTPMPAYSDSFSEEDLWALSYYVLSLSAYKDPLTKQPLKVSDEMRNALNNPELRADSSEEAYIPKSYTAGEQADQFGGEAWAGKHGIGTQLSVKVEPVVSSVK